MLIITGPGRSGTSVFARFCEQVGYDTGGSWNEEINAGKEWGKVVDKNQQIREGKNPDISGIDRTVIKDPRFVLLDGVIEYWLQRREDLKFIVLERDPDKIAKSVQRHPWFFDGEYKRNNASVIREKLNHFYNVLSTNNIPYRMLRFPDFLSNYKRIYNILTIFGGLSFDFTDGQYIWRELIDWDKVHIN